MSYTQIKIPILKYVTLIRETNWPITFNDIQLKLLRSLERKMSDNLILGVFEASSLRCGLLVTIPCLGNQKQGPEYSEPDAQCAKVD